MATLIDTSSTTNGTYEYVRNNDPPVSVDQSHSRSIMKRVGTGRRKKPAYPDNTPYEYREEKVIGPYGKGQWKSKTTTQSWTGALPKFLTGNLTAGLQEPLDWDLNLRNLARVEALAALNKQDLDLGTAWAERGKTAQMVGDLATKSVRTIAAARKGRGREILDIWGLNHKGARGRGFVDSYLTYHYGIKPTLYDVAGAVDALTRMPPGRWKMQTKGKQGYDRFQSTQVGLGSFYPFLVNSQVRQSCRTLVSAIQRPLTREQDIAWALGLDNPLGTAWELTAFSFVFDWVIPIGDYLQALNSKKYFDGWEVVDSQFRKESCQFLGSSGTVSGANPITCDTTIHGGAYKKVDVRRLVTNGPPMLGIPVKDPRSLDHMAKALALWASSLARGGIPRHVRY